MSRTMTVLIDGVPTERQVDHINVLTSNYFGNNFELFTPVPALRSGESIMESIDGRIHIVRGFENG